LIHRSLHITFPDVDWPPMAAQQRALRQEERMLNGWLKAVDKSQTLLLNEQSRQLETAGREVFKFGFGQSPFPPLPAAVEALRAHAAAKDYTPVQGLPELRERVAQFHRAVDGLDWRADQVLVAPGSKLLL